MSCVWRACKKGQCRICSDGGWVAAVGEFVVSTGDWISLYFFGDLGDWVLSAPLPHVIRGAGPPMRALVQSARVRSMGEGIRRVEL